MPDTDLTTLDDDALDQLRVAILTEQERRQRLATIPGQVQTLVDQYVSGGGNLADLADVLP